MHHVNSHSIFKSLDYSIIFAALVALQRAILVVLNPRLSLMVFLEITLKMKRSLSDHFCNDAERIHIRRSKIIIQ